MYPVLAASVLLVHSILNYLCSQVCFKGVLKVILGGLPGGQGNLVKQRSFSLGMSALFKLRAASAALTCRIPPCLLLPIRRPCGRKRECAHHRCLPLSRVRIAGMGDAEVSVSGSHHHPRSPSTIRLLVRGRCTAALRRRRHVLAYVQVEAEDEGAVRLLVAAPHALPQGQLEGEGLAQLQGGGEGLGGLGEVRKGIGGAGRAWGGSMSQNVTACCMGVW